MFSLIRKRSVVWATPAPRVKVERCGPSIERLLVSVLPGVGGGIVQSVTERIHARLHRGRCTLASSSMRTEDARIVLGTDGVNDPIVDHPDQPVDYIHR